jgi:Ca2+-binding EF-hand superfamily protein
MSLTDQELMAIMATFKSFDVDGDGCLGKDELKDILYRISEGQTFEEVDQEVDDIMEACDKDKSGQISYAEFFSSQKRHDFTPKADAAIQKLIRFMALKDSEKQQKIGENHDNFVRLLKEKEEAIARERREKENEEADKRRREELAKHGSPEVNSPIISNSNDEESEDQEPSEQEISSDNVVGRATSTNGELQVQLSQANAKIAVIEQDLNNLRSLNEKTQYRVKELEPVEKSVDGLRIKVKALETENAELRQELELARSQQSSEEENEREMTQMRQQVSEEKDLKNEALLKLENAKLEITTLNEKYEKAVQGHTQRLHEEKVSRSNDEVVRENALQEKKRENSDLKTKISQFEAKISQLEKSLATTTIEHDILKAEVTSIKGQLHSAREENESLKNLQRTRSDARVEEEEALRKTAQRAEEERDAAQEALRKATDEALRAKDEHQEVLIRVKEESQRVVDELELSKARHEDEAAQLRANLGEKEADLEKLRKQLQRIPTELSQAHMRPVEVDEESPYMIEQRRLRDRVKKNERTLRRFHAFYALWVFIVLYIAWSFAPERASNRFVLNPS